MHLGNCECVWDLFHLQKKQYFDNYVFFFYWMLFIKIYFSNTRTHTRKHLQHNLIIKMKCFHFFPRAHFCELNNFSLFILCEFIFKHNGNDKDGDGDKGSGGWKICCLFFFFLIISLLIVRKNMLVCWCKNIIRNIQYFIVYKETKIE